MKVTQLLKQLFLVLAIASSFARAEEDDEMEGLRQLDVYENYVLVLDESNFDAALEANEYLMVYFYAPWW